MRLEICLFLYLCYLLSACSTIEKNSIPNAQGYDNVNAYSNTLASQPDVSKEPLGFYPNMDDYILTIKDGNDNKVKNLLTSFSSLCDKSKGSIYFDKDEWKDRLVFSPDYLLKEFDISEVDLKKYGSVIKQYRGQTLDSSKPPDFDYINLDIRSIAAFWGINRALAKKNGFDRNSTPAYIEWGKQSAICATLEEDNTRYYFAWAFGVSPQKANKTHDLYVTIRNSESLSKTEKSRVESYFSSKKKHENEIAAWHKKQEKLLVEEEKERAAKLKRQKALNEAHKKIVRQNRQKTERFRKNLKEGDETHCGLVIEVKPTIVKIQSIVGPYWLKKDKIYPLGLANCKFVNGQYVSPKQPEF